jgi:hypothetical protein
MSISSAYLPLFLYQMCAVEVRLFEGEKRCKKEAFKGKLCALWKREKIKNNTPTRFKIWHVIETFAPTTHW